MVHLLVVRVDSVGQVAHQRSGYRMMMDLTVMDKGVTALSDDGAAVNMVTEEVMKIVVASNFTR